MSIRLRLTVVYTAILTGFFLCFGLFSYFVARTTLLSAVDDTLRNTALQVLGETEAFSSGDMMLLTFPENMNIFQAATVFMVVVDPQGQVLTRSPNLQTFEGVLDPRGLQQTEPAYSTISEYGRPLRVFTYPIQIQRGAEPQIIGHLQLAQPLDSYQAALNRLGTILAITGGGVFFFFLFLGGLTTHSLLKPLGEITAVALQISRADDLGRRLPDNGRRDEIGHLTMALNQTFERLEKLFRAQQRLLADVSHELRTPLTTVRGNIDLMKQLGEFDRESLDIMQDELERMTRLVGDLLLLARADGGSLPVSQIPLELDTILFDVYRQVQPLRKDKKVDVLIAEVVPCRVEGDPDRIKQLVLILVDNAIKYTPEGGTVTLSLTREDNDAWLSVTDTGPGIAPEHLPHIFDRFYRVDKARSRALGGSGLGLSIAKWIAEAHGGAIKVTSTKGEGSRFHIRLPTMTDDWPDIHDDDLETLPIFDGSGIITRQTDQ